MGELSSLQMAPVDLVADAAWLRSGRATGNGVREAKLSSRAFAALARVTTSLTASATATRGRGAGVAAHPAGPAVLPEPACQPADEDSADRKLPGNTLIIGSTGVGKTTLEMFLLALTRKWGTGTQAGAV